MLLAAVFVFSGQLVMAGLTDSQKAAFYAANQNSGTLRINDDNNVAASNYAKNDTIPKGTTFTLTQNQWSNLNSNDSKNIFYTRTGSWNNYTYHCTVNNDFKIQTDSLGTVLGSQNIYKDSGQREKVYTLFNKYFELTGNAAYTSSDELYQHRGVKTPDGKLGDVTWISTGDSTFYASALSAGNQNTLSIVDPGTKNTIGGLKWEFGSGENQILGGGKSGQELGIGSTEFEWKLTSTAGTGNNAKSTDWFSNTDNNLDKMIHMIVMDVSDLMLDMLAGKNNWVLGDDYSYLIDGKDGNFIWDAEGEIWNEYFAYMTCWEDTSGKDTGCDFDYQDMVAIISYIKPVYVHPVTPPGDGDAGASGGTTPEPATMLLIGLGMAGAGFAARRRKIS